jgi:DNA-damage-inducible protein J
VWGYRATFIRMNKTATIHARIDRATKTISEDILKKIGMTPTEAVRLLYRQIALRKEFPLELRIPNKLTAETLSKSDKNEEIEYFDSVKDLELSWKDE